MAVSTIKVEVCYARSDRQTLIPLLIAEGATIEQAIQQSGILQMCPEIDLAHNKVGIFSKVKDLTTILADGDRIEIYRPLLIDAKQARLKKVVYKQKRLQK